MGSTSGVVITLPLLLITVGYFRLRYSTDKGLITLRDSNTKLLHLQREIRKEGEQAGQAEHALNAEVERMASEERGIKNQLDLLPVQEQQLVADAGQRATILLDEVGRLRVAIRDNEEQELRTLQRDMTGAIADLDRRIASLPQEERDEYHQALTRLKEQHLQQRLQSVLLANATIPGIGSKIRDRLISAGFRTAADITRQVFD